MIGWGQVTGKSMLSKSYPWGDLPADTNVVDVGGGNGHVTLDLLQAFPHLKITVQDLPAVVEQAKEVVFISSAYPSVIRSALCSYGAKNTPRRSKNNVWNSFP